MNFIYDIFKKTGVGDSHLQFQKFSRGEFKDRAMIVAKRTGSKYTIKTSAEFANGLVRDVAKILGKERAMVTGAIVSTSDLKSEISYKEIKQFQGVKRYLIEQEMSGEEILSLLDKFPKAFFALSLQAGTTSLKIKPKAPKSGKPGSKGEEKVKADFCTLVTEDKSLGSSFIFEAPDFKRAEVNHTFFIDEIVIPASLKAEKDYSVIREKALRKGRILRTAVIDERPGKEETSFEA